MRRSLARHLRQVKPKITKVIATHAHEEHIGNLNWLSEVTGAPICVSELTARFLTPIQEAPLGTRYDNRSASDLKQPYHLLDETIDSDSGFSQGGRGTPGHCDDHIALYDPDEKVLLAGDAFVGSFVCNPQSRRGQPEVAPQSRTADGTRHRDSGEGHRLVRFPRLTCRFAPRA